MNYLLHYDNLITRARGRSFDEYGEVHHIIPRCMNGSDETENLVKLTPEEHYVAHLLLVKIYSNRSLIYAANMMMLTRGNKQYGWMKRRFSMAHSEHMKVVMKGVLKSDDHCLAMRKPKSNTENMHSMLGKSHSEETKLAMSNSHRGKVKSDEHKSAIAKALIGNNNRDWTGKHHSTETKAKLSVVARNRSAETRHYV